jgi:pyridoxamine 5'-phosphate oxidase
VNVPRPDTLAEVEAAVWRELASAAHDRSHGWRTGVLATADGEGADARSVILREVEPEARTLLIFTDARSPKVAQLQAHPKGTLVLWSPALSWQLRLRVDLVLETEGLRVSSRWARLSMTAAAQDYLAPQPPGSPLLEPPAPARESRNHFAVIAARVEQLDWLELHPAGHRRAIFGAGGAAWVTP